jgi:hypothetical protein
MRNRMIEMEIDVEKVNAMANVILAMKATVIPDRNRKDEIISSASTVIYRELLKEKGDLLFSLDARAFVD